MSRRSSARRGRAAGGSAGPAGIEPGVHAITHGTAEIREVLLQSAIYCGVPAANTAFRIAREVLGEADPA